MKATIERATLLRSLGHVHSVVERRNTIPILSNVLLEAREDGSLRLMATDLDLQINDTIEAQVQQTGATTVAAHTLFEIARKLPAGSQVEPSAPQRKEPAKAARAPRPRPTRCQGRRAAPRRVAGGTERRRGQEAGQCRPRPLQSLHLAARRLP